MKYKIIIAAVIGIFCLIFLASFFMLKGNDAKTVTKTLLNDTNITLNGTKPWDITVHNEDLYNRVMNQGSLGLGESYMDGWWDCSAIDQLCFTILQEQLDKKITFTWPLFFAFLKAKLINLQSKERALQAAL